jgi:hypothetical protein
MDGRSLRQTIAVWSAFGDELDGVYESDLFVSVSPQLVQKREGTRSQDVLLRQAGEFFPYHKAAPRRIRFHNSL